MRLEIKEQKDNPLLHRVEIKAELNYAGITPSREDVRKAVADKQDVDPDQVVVREIQTIFGLEKANAVVFVYDNKHKDEIGKIEPKEGKKAREKREKAGQSISPDAGEANEEKPAEKEEGSKDKKGSSKEEPSAEKSKDEKPEDQQPKSEEDKKE